MKARKLIAMLLVVATLMSFAPMAVFAAGNKTVTVQYFYAGTTTVAANPWTASLAEGSDYSGTIKHPEIVGYEATAPEPVGGADVTFSSTGLDLTIENIQSDINIVVYYQPAMVEYTVKYFQQNVNDDDYTLVATQVKEARTNSVVEVNKTADEGFYILPYDETITVAADSSTVVEVYFDRDYYLMKFDLGEGGYGVDPIYARYGTAIGDVGTPVRPGYTFTGWDKTVAETMPAGNVTYTALWTPATVDYTVMYWKENANDSNYSFWTYEERQATAGTEVTGTGDKTETGFYFDHADTKTVAGDGTTIINVYYKRNTYTLYFMLQHEHSESECGLNCGGTSYSHWWHDESCYNCGKSSGEWSAAASFSGIKYEADTSPWWSQGPSGYRWRLDSSSTRAYTYAPTMTNADLYTYGEDVGTSYLYTIHYYEEGTTNKVRDDNSYYRNGNSYTLGSEDYVAIPGFTCVTSGETSANSNLEFSVYYRRNSYSLTFHNANTTIDGGTHLYQADISGKYFVPELPAGMEANSVTFGGWYTTQDCLDGTEFKFEGATMPVDGLILYAKWAPVTHDVKVYLTDKDAEAGTNQIGDTQKVSHRGFATEPAEPDNGNYTFITWFYKDENGVEKAFDFASMPIIKDMVIYAKWSSKVLVDYTIHYYLEGTTTKVADSTTGRGLVLTTKTFEAKVENALYPDYQEGFFPNVPSHSMKFSIDGDNTFIFYYTEREVVPYTVKYLYADSGESVFPDYVNNENLKAVVTETAPVKTGYMADAYQKRLIVSVDDPSKNVLIFYYTADTKNAFVVEEHTLVKNGEESQFSFSQSPEAIGSNVTKAAFDSIQGYVFDHVEVTNLATGEKVSYAADDESEANDYIATVPSGGLHFEFFYRYDRFDVYYQSTKATVTYDLVDTFNVVERVHAGYLYGGMYTDETFTKPLETVGEDAGNGMAFQPKAGATYYVKEIDDKFVSPGYYLVYNKADGGTMDQLYLITAIDNANYNKIGFELNVYGEDGTVAETKELATTTLGNADNDFENSIHEKFEVKFWNQNFVSQRTETYTASSLFTVEEKEDYGYLYVRKYTDEFVGEQYIGKEVDCSAFYVTPDNVRVEGYRVRHLVNGNNMYGGFTKVVTLRSSEAFEQYTQYHEAQVMAFAPLMMRRAYTISGDVVEKYDITKIAGDITEVQTVEPGDNTGAITYTEKSGYIFAGWYTDEACTVAADFSDVQGDMTVYAKYIEAKKVNVTMTAVGKYMTATVTVPGTNVPAVGVSYTFGGETTEVSCKKYNGILSTIAKLLGSKSETYTASWNMNQLANGDTFTATAYWTTADGTVVEIETGSFICSRNRISQQ